MKKNTVLDRLRYTFDNFMAKGTIALIGGLALVSASLVILAGFIVSSTGIAPDGGTQFSFMEATWQSMMRAIDSGAIGADTGWPLRLIMLVVTVAGIFIVSILIGLLSSGIEAKLEDLRKGRSRVIETDHTVILGWSLQIFTLLSELILANANRPNACIVILSPEDKVMMEDTIREWLGSQRHTRIVCRTGNPSDMADLGMVSIQTARAVIILSSASESNSVDAQLIKTLLAITNIPRPNATPYHIVAQVQNTQSLAVLDLVGGAQVEPLLTSDLISRIMVQTSRQSGLSTVYMELLDFSGDEIYIKTEPALVGKSYSEILMAYDTSAVIGLLQDGMVHLNPAPETRLQSGGGVILITEDDDTARLSGITRPAIAIQSILNGTLPSTTPERTLILGWNAKVISMLQQLDQYVAEGSETMVVANFPDGEVEIASHCAHLNRQTIHYQVGNPTERSLLDQLQVNEYHHVIVLCSDYLTPEEADAQTLVTLLQLRDIENHAITSSPNGQGAFPIVTEVLDSRNQALVQVTQPDDFVISEQIISRMLAQVAEQKSLNTVFTQLFSPEGAEIYLKPATNYVASHEPVNFYTVIEAAKRQGETAIGYRRDADAGNVARAYGVVLNPPKSNLINFNTGDRIIVLAEN